MHLYLDTSTPDCIVKLSFAKTRPDFSTARPSEPDSAQPSDPAASPEETDTKIFEYHEPLGRDMAEKLHAYLNDIFKRHGKTWRDLTSITYFSGPGSFTGLRIGASVVNTLADQLNIPLYDHHGNQKPLILPEYGRPANITVAAAPSALR